jgi:dipeptidyl aminopeptidase/acylaminoacyl peptidase
MSTFTIEELVDLEHPSEVQLSPDGARVAFVRGKANKADADASFQKTIHLVDVSTGSTRPLTAPNTGANDQPRWSPDSRRLAFVSNRANIAETQLYLLDLDGGEAQPLTDLRGEVDEPKWAADGRSIAFLYDGTLDPVKQPDPDPIVVDEGTRFKRVWRLDLDTRALTPLTPEGEHVFEYAWAGDGKTLVALTSPHPNPIESWYSAQLHAVDLASGALNRLCTMPNQIGRLALSPDSARLAFVSGIMSDEGNVSGEVYLVPVAGGEPTNITEGVDYSITWIDWRDEGILFGGRQIEGAVLGWLDPESGEERWLDKGMYAINGWGAQKVSPSGSGKQFAALRESFTERPSVYFGSLDTGVSRPLAAPDMPMDKFPPLRVENRYWTGVGGQPVHGYLVYPPNYEPGKRYPLFNHVHGGPSWSYVPRFVSGWERLMTDRGCLVFLPNPRGSWGRGHAFQSANVGDLGGGDWQDIMLGVDSLISAGLVDPDQMAVGGWSYGGYLTTWAVTQTDRFKCAFAGASITNYESNYGVVPNREWQTTMFGSNVYDDFELHRSRSPIAFANRVKTPTMLVHGDQDPYAPMQQAVEFYIALKHFNVPAQLVIYPREPHGFQQRAHQIDMYQRLVGWVDKWLFGQG